MERVGGHALDHAVGQAGAEKAVLAARAGGIVERRDLFGVGKVEAEVAAGDELGVIRLLHQRGAALREHGAVGVGDAAAPDGGAHVLPLEHVAGHGGDEAAEGVFVQYAVQLQGGQGRNVAAVVAVGDVGKAQVLDVRLDDVLAAPQGHARGVGTGDGHGVLVVVKKDEAVEMAAHGLVKRHVALGGVAVAKEQALFLRRGHAAPDQRLRRVFHIFGREKGHLVEPLPHAGLHVLIVGARGAGVGGVEGHQQRQAHPSGRDEAGFFQMIDIRAQNILKTPAAGGKADADPEAFFVHVLPSLIRYGDKYTALSWRKRGKFMVMDIHRCQSPPSSRPRRRGLRRPPALQARRRVPVRPAPF